MMEVDALTRWLGVIALIVSIGNTCWVWLSRSGHELSAKIDDIEDEIDGHDSRIQAVEGELKHLPSKDDVNRLQLSLADANGKLGMLESEMASIARTVRRIDDYLREKA